jgi:hypothetical protein
MGKQEEPKINLQNAICDMKIDGLFKTATPSKCSSALSYTDQSRIADNLLSPAARACKVSQVSLPCSDKYLEKDKTPKQSSVLEDYLLNDLDNIANTIGDVDGLN